MTGRVLRGLTMLAACLATAAPACDPAWGADDPPRPAPASSHPISLEIVDATYGLRRTSYACSATDAVVQLCRGRARCEVSVADTLCGPGRPPPSVLIATLAVRYHCFSGDVDRSASQDRPFVLRISCLGVGH